MPNSFVIGGQTGKAMDATQRSWKALRIGTAKVRFASLDEEYFEYVSGTDDATGAGVILPEYGQVVEIYETVVNVKRFRGHVTQIKPSSRGVSVRVDGPWWWMNKANLSGNFTPPFDTTGTAAVRHNYAFPTQDLGTSFAALIDRFIAVGVPILRGTIATMFQFVPIQLPNMSCAAALAEMMRLVPDAVAWLDHSTSVPTLNISRRSSMTALTLALGTDHIQQLDIAPRLELKIDRVEAHYTDRHPTTTRARFQSQASGTATPGNVQIVTVSGPERFQSLPIDQFDTVYIKSSSTVDNTVISSRDTTLSSLGKAFGFIGYVSNAIYYYTSTAQSGIRQYTYTSFPSAGVLDANGVVVNTTGKYFLLSADSLPEWAVKSLAAKQVTFVGTWLCAERGSPWSAAFTGWNASAPIRGNGFADATGSDFIYWCAYPYSIQLWMVNVANTGGNIYKPADYAYITPPANFAANMLATQNWMPWDGSIKLKEDSLTLENLIKNKIHVSGSLADCASMGALLRGITYDFGDRTRSFDLGPPTRIDFRTLVNRIRQEPQGTITYL